MAAALFLLKDINLTFEFGVWSNGARGSDYLTTLNLIALDAAKEKTGVIASLTLIESLMEGFDTGNDGFLSILKANNFNFVIDMDSTLFDTTSSDSTTTLNGEDILNWHQEWFVEIMLWYIKVFIHSFNEFHNGIFVLFVAFEGFSCRTLDDWTVAIETILLEKITDIFFNELNEIRISKIHLVQEDDNLWNVHLVSQEYVLTSLWQSTIVSSDYEDSAINLCGTGNHVLNIVGVTWHVDVSVVTLLGFILLVRSCDGNTASLFLWSVIDLIISDWLVDIRRKSLSENSSNSSRQSGFTVVNVTHGTDIDMWLATVKICHSLIFSFIFNNF